jgi:hypothetical protein
MAEGVIMYSANENRNGSYIETLREVAICAKEVLQSEIELAKAELSEATKTVGSQILQTGIFAGLCALSALPFLAFAIIGLGILLDGMYWLSSLIVALICGGGGGFFAVRSYEKIVGRKLTLPHARQQLEDIKAAATGEGEVQYEPYQLH